VVSGLGYNTLLIREVARAKTQASKYMNNVLGLRALLSLVIFAFIYCGNYQCNGLSCRYKECCVSI